MMVALLVCVVTRLPSALGTEVLAAVTTTRKTASSDASKVPQK